jgi:hypothetical protein
MTTHELANILLQQRNVPVHFQYFDGGPEQYLNSEVYSVHEYNDIVYLSESHLLFPPDERYDEYDGKWIGETEDDSDPIMVRISE